ncbi:unannotated protein [freshwater metagenome]|uniref:Unannotated protein n=1 Tax=freshwater metagenome TaxID=449393 RepID=A0A6J7KUX7_9ZZZZ|nr:glycosyltransferase [Actinomycetota bacterium]
MSRPTYDVSVVTTVRDVADARLHRIVGALADVGLTVEVLGFGTAEGAPPQASAVRIAPRRGAAGRIASSLASPWRARGRVVLVLDPDAVPSAWVRRLAGHPLVVDLSEDYAALLNDRAWAHGLVGALSRWGARASTALAGRADLTVVADTHVPPMAARNRVVLRNLPYGDYLPPPTAPDPEPRALYIGDLRISRGLFDMIEAVAAAPGWTLDLVGPVSSTEESALTSRLACDDVRGRVRLHGRRPPREAWELARGAWVGFSLLHDTPAFRDAMPSKVFEYLTAGLAVVASPLPRQAELLTASAAGTVVDGPDAATAALRAYVAEPALLEMQRAAAREWAPVEDEEYSRFAGAVMALARTRGR